MNNNLSKAKNQPFDPRSIEYSDMRTIIGREQQFRSVCRDFRMKKYFANDRSSTLKCHLLHHNDPYLKLGPHFLEVVNESPYVSIFHKIISKKEMNELKEIARPNYQEKNTQKIGKSHKIQLNKKLHIRL